MTSCSGHFSSSSWCCWYAEIIPSSTTLQALKGHISLNSHFWLKKKIFLCIMISYHFAPYVASSKLHSAVFEPSGFISILKACCKQFVSHMHSRAEATIHNPICTVHTINMFSGPKNTVLKGNTVWRDSGPNGEKGHQFNGRTVY